MLVEQNTYAAYTDNLLVGVSPMGLVVALYQGAIDALGQAKRCYSVGDIMGRGTAVTKANNILSELISSLDMEKGGDISVNLKKLYSYMQSRILSAHMQQIIAPITEVEGLLMELLEAWKTASDHNAYASAEPASAASQTEDFGELIVDAPEQEVTYTGYFLEAAASTLGQAYSF